MNMITSIPCVSIHAIAERYAERAVSAAVAQAREAEKSAVANITAGAYRDRMRLDSSFLNESTTPLARMRLQVAAAAARVK